MPRVARSPTPISEAEEVEEIEAQEEHNGRGSDAPEHNGKDRPPDQDMDQLALESSSTPIRRGGRALQSRSGTHLSRKEAHQSNAPSASIALPSRSTSLLEPPSRSSRHSSPSSSSTRVSASVRDHPNKRTKLGHPTWAAFPPPTSASLTPALAGQDTPLRGRGIPTVLLPHVPLETLKRYIHAGGTTRILERYAASESSLEDDGQSEEGYSGESEDAAYDGVSYSRMTRATAGGQGRVKRSRGSGSSDIEYDDGSSDPLAGSFDGSGSDGDGGSDNSMAERMRRTRGGEKRSNGNKVYGKQSSRVPPLRSTRSQNNGRPLRQQGNRSDSDQDQDDEEEGESEIDELEIDEMSVDEDQLEASSDEDYQSDSSYDGPSRKKRKGNGKAKKKAQVWEEEETPEELLGRHRDFCEKCMRIPATYLVEAAQKRKNKGKQKKRKEEDEFELDEVEQAVALGGWLECGKCVTSWHWGCAGQHQRDDVLALLMISEGPYVWGKKRLSVEVEEMFEFECRKCQNQPACFVCHEVDLPVKSKPGGKDLKGDGDAASEEGGAEKAVESDGAAKTSVMIGNANGEAGAEEDEDIVMLDRPSGSPVKANGTRNGKVAAEEGDTEKEDEIRSPLRFRCFRCKQGAHYVHLPKPPRAKDLDEWTVVDRASYYQNESGAKGKNAWFCHQCREWTSTVDIVIAWRPVRNSVPEPNEPDYHPSWKDDLPREYLVRFVGRGFRHVQWVSHAWLRSMGPQRLRNFLEKGPSLDLITDETLAAKGDTMAAPTISNLLHEADEEAASRQSRHAHKEEGEGGKAKAEKWVASGPGPEVDAQSGLPVEWSTVDRVLDVCLRMPPKPPKSAKAAKIAPAKAKNGRNRNVVLSESEDEPEEDPLDSLPPLPDGLEPDPEDRVEIDEWEAVNKRQLYASDVDDVAKLATWCFVKWDDLQYDQSTWDTPPPRDSALYPAFKRALERYLKARRVRIPILDKKAEEERDACVNKRYNPPESQPDCVVGGKLMPFQLNGLQWMLTKHFKRESAILADDMGLGKTVQIASLLGVLGSKKIYPCLVVVPNSTITNWVREFEKWVPHMRVVPYYGEASSRKVIRQYELYHKGMTGKAEGLKAHIVLTTYDMITSSDFKVYAGIPRWEVLVVDEGQRLKSDSSLIFARLRKLNTIHRLLLTGTPLNNNIRELFNLLNFLDPHEFTDREELEKRYDQDSLTEEKVHELHEIVKPYILRRIKADVLKLPPKIEIIVPISLSPLQKHLYRLIVDRNVEHIKAVAEARQKKAKAREAREKEREEKRLAKEAREKEEAEARGDGAGQASGMEVDESAPVPDGQERVSRSNVKATKAEERAPEHGETAAEASGQDGGETAQAGGEAD